MAVHPKFIFSPHDAKPVRTCLTNSNRRCSYCEESKEPQDMTSVPTDEEILDEWKTRLGPIFTTNLGDKMCNRICREHMEDWNRKLSVLPKKLYFPPGEKEIEEKEDEEEEELEEEDMDEEDEEEENEEETEENGEEESNEEEEEEYVHHEEIEDNGDEDFAMEQDVEMEEADFTAPVDIPIVPPTSSVAQQAQIDEAIAKLTASVAEGFKFGGLLAQPTATAARQAKIDEAIAQFKASVAEVFKFDEPIMQPAASVADEVNVNTTLRKTRNSAKSVPKASKSEQSANQFQKIVKDELEEEESTSSGLSKSNGLEKKAGTSSKKAKPAPYKYSIPSMDEILKAPKLELPPIIIKNEPDTQSGSQD